MLHLVFAFVAFLTFVGSVATCCSAGSAVEILFKFFIENDTFFHAKSNNPKLFSVLLYLY